MLRVSVPARPSPPVGLSIAALAREEMLGHLARDATVRLARATLLGDALEGRLLGHLVGL